MSRETLNDVWRPLGVRRTVAAIFSRRPIYASWRHFGWELELERTPGSYYVCLHKLDGCT